jgi:hypothetical protein
LSRSRESGYSACGGWGEAMTLDRIVDELVRVEAEMHEMREPNTWSHRPVSVWRLTAEGRERLLELRLALDRELIRRRDRGSLAQRILQSEEPAGNRPRQSESVDAR